MPRVGLHGEAVTAGTGSRHAQRGGPAIYRAMGSLAFTAAVRGVWAVTRDPHDDTDRRRFLLPVKNNIAVDDNGLAFEIRQADGLPAIHWSELPVRPCATAVSAVLSWALLARRSDSTAPRIESPTKKTPAQAAPRPFTWRPFPHFTSSKLRADGHCRHGSGTRREWGEQKGSREAAGESVSVKS